MRRPPAPTVVAVLAVVAALIPAVTGTASAAAAALDADGCLARPAGSVTAFSQPTVRDSEYQVVDPPADHTFDLRNLTSTAFGSTTRYPLMFGRDAAATYRLCSVGGTVLGQQPRTLSWREMKDQWDGDGLHLKGAEWVASHGFRVDNVEDGFAPRPDVDAAQDGWRLENAYMTYVRDDAVENDAGMSGTIADSLVDGVFQFHSADSSTGTTVPGSVVAIEDTLVRFEQMPVVNAAGETDTLCTYEPSCSDGRAHNDIFKGNRIEKYVVRNSIFLAEERGVGGSTMSLSDRGTYENVTIVWLGAGDYPGRIYPGVTVTRDRAAWDDARARWLARHGCPATGDATGTSCTRLADPDPLPVTLPSLVAGTSGSTGSAKATTFSLAHTVPDGTVSPYVVVGVAWRNSSVPTLSSVTYGGVRLTQLGPTLAPSSSLRLATFGLAAPPTGARQVAVTLSGTAGIALSARTFADVGTTAPPTVVSAIGRSTTASVRVPSSSNEVVVDWAAAMDATTKGTVGPGQVVDVNRTVTAGSAEFRVLASRENGSFGSTMSWTLSRQKQWGTLGIALTGTA